MSTEKKLTAVEWLDRELDFLLELYPSENKKLDELIKKAKELEKQQIIDAYQNAESEMSKRFSSDMHKWVGAEQYYNETYKK